MKHPIASCAARILAISALLSLPCLAQTRVDLSAHVEPAALPQGLCAPEWSVPFGHEPGVGRLGGGNAIVNDAVVHDDGTGPALYVAGLFSSAGGEVANNIARWDGTNWSEVGGGVDGPVEALAVADFGSGPELYVGGDFDSGGGGAALANVAKWNGIGWSSPGGGVNDTVRALHTIEGGVFSNDVLILGGHFTVAGGITSGGFGVNAARIATYAGFGFAPLGDGLDDTVLAVTYHAGSIHAGGIFDKSGATFLFGVGRWTGSGWVAVGGGGPLSGSVSCMTSFDDGGGPDLYVGGSFSSLGSPSVSAANIARLDGTTWSPLGSGLPLGAVYDLHGWDDGAGADLYIAGTWGSSGQFERVIQWDGAEYHDLGSGINLDGAYCLTDFDPGTGSELIVGGTFPAAGGIAASSLARWDGAAWSSTGDGLSNDVRVAFSSSFDGIPALYVGLNWFSHAPGSVGQRGLARFQDGAWSGIGDVQGAVLDMLVWDDGGGEKLYVVGGFSSVDGVPAAAIACWDGANWSDVGGGVSGALWSVEVWDDGTGEALYVGGNMGSAGGVPANTIARWDGSNWSAVGGGALSAPGAIVFDMEPFQGDLWVTGNFSSNTSAPADGLARWDGSTWSGPAGDLTNLIGNPAGGQCLAVFDDGGGERLWVGGSFFEADGTPDTTGLAGWNGSDWTGVPTDGDVFTMAVYDGGQGKRLHFGGSFEQAGSPAVPVSRLASWDGSNVFGMGSPLPQPDAEPMTMVVHDRGTGDGPELVVGGPFTVVPNIDPNGTPGGGSYLGAWGGCWNGVTAWTDLGFALPGVSGAPLLTGSGTLALGSVNDVDLTNGKPSALAGLFMSFASTPTPFAGGTLIPVPWLDPIILTLPPSGALPLTYTVASCLPPGVELYMQWVIQDGAAISGFALSNAIVGITP